MTVLKNASATCLTLDDQQKWGKKGKNREICHDYQVITALKP
jgi:hypothetical protein